jgi:hypothetical protein
LLSVVEEPQVLQQLVALKETREVPEAPEVHPLLQLVVLHNLLPQKVASAVAADTLLAQVVLVGIPRTHQELQLVEVRHFQHQLARRQHQMDVSPQVVVQVVLVTEPLRL